ncbi:MAG: hypothetical protein WCA46_04420 [Actinocatenispora sp.]
MIIQWRGAGILALLLPILGGAAGYGLRALGLPDVVVTCGILAGSIATWVVGRRLNRQVDDVDKVHSLWGIPMQYWAFLWSALALAGLVVVLSR